MIPGWSTIVRFGLTAVCLALMGNSFAMFLGWQRHRDDLVDLLREAGFDERNGGVIDRVRFERTSHHAQVLAARALVYEVLDAGNKPPEPVAVGLNTDPGSDARAPLDIGSVAWEAAVDRLPIAADQARSVLAVQPNSWQAAMLLGASIYLERSIRRDPALYTAYHDWEDPLWEALEAAPGQAEPRRFLAAAYLEVWPALAPAKKKRTRELLTEAFATDPQAFRTLLPAWLEVAGGLDDAFAVIPDSSYAWGALGSLFAGQKRWEAFCRAHVRRQEVSFAENQAMLDEAEDRLRLGDLFHSRSLLLQVVARSPLDRRFAPLVARALERYPPGLHGLSSTEPLRAWLRWALELHAFGKSPLPPRVVSRLAGAVGDLEAPEKALAALVGGEIHYAESLELLADTLSSEPWGPYVLAKTRWYLLRDQPGEAAATLNLAGRATQRTLPYALVRREAARARGDLVELAAAEREVGGFQKSEWSAAEWQWRGYRALLPILARAPAPGLVLAVNRVPAAGAVVEIRWDGRSLALQPVTADGEIELVFPVDTDLHVLEVRTLAGEQVFPGRVRLPE